MKTQNNKQQSKTAHIEDVHQIPEEVFRDVILPNLTPADKISLLTLSQGYCENILEHFEHNPHEARHALLAAVKAAKGYQARKIADVLERQGKEYGIISDKEGPDDAYPEGAIVNVFEAAAVLAAMNNFVPIVLDLLNRIPMQTRISMTRIAKYAVENGSKDLYEIMRTHYLVTPSNVITNLDVPSTRTQGEKYKHLLLDMIRCSFLPARSWSVNGKFVDVPLNAFVILLSLGLNLEEFETVEDVLLVSMSRPKMLVVAARYKNVEIFSSILNKLRASPCSYQEVYFQRIREIAPRMAQYLP
jgi:hypothetical protein